jgi:hypothetical protein
LDNINKIFKHEHCSKCQYRKPHPGNWKWTRTWQNQELGKEIHKEFNDNLP